ncbi:hypothetical protein [Smaragdicoccus niigatensis]|uniref:hypothetical protein n=1 Tax=Smaragdicoccus niigatensis TaxID=359359 RepID=UPI000379EC47|nr:hypothetical protein [Smaragdicoccus niigatensis]
MNAFLVRLPLTAYFLYFATVATVVYIGFNALAHQDLNFGRSLFLAVIVSGVLTSLERGQRQRGDWDSRVRYTRALRGRGVSGDITTWATWIHSDDKANTKSAAFAVSVLAVLGSLALIFADWRAAAVLLSLAALAMFGFVLRRRRLRRLQAKLNHPSMRAKFALSRV